MNPPLSKIENSRGAALRLFSNSIPSNHARNRLKTADFVWQRGKSLKSWFRYEFHANRVGISVHCGCFWFRFPWNQPNTIINFVSSAARFGTNPVSIGIPQRFSSVPCAQILSSRSASLSCDTTPWAHSSFSSSKPGGVFPPALFPRRWHTLRCSPGFRHWCFFKGRKPPIVGSLSLLLPPSSRLSPSSPSYHAPYTPQ